MKTSLTLVILLNWLLCLAQTKTINFCYTVDGQDYKGSLKADFNFSSGGMGHGDIPNVVNYVSSDYRKLKISVTLRGVRWEERNHYRELELELPDGLEELIEDLDGIRMLDYSDEPLRNNTISVNFGFTALDESTATGIPIIAAIKQRGCEVDYDDGQESVKSGCLLGLVVVADYFMIDAGDMAEDDLLAAEFIMDGLVAVVDNKMEEMSCAVAYEIKNGGNLDDIDIEDLLNPEYNLERMSVPKAKSMPTLSPDDATYTRASKKNDTKALESYIVEYPTGKNVEKAKSKLKELEPFQHDSPVKNGDNFNIQFTKGIGSKMPDVEFSDNGDYAIKYQWASNNLLIATLPEERSTVVVVSLGEKQVSIPLGNAFAELNAKWEMIDGRQVKLSQISGGKPPYTLVVVKGGAPVKSFEIGNVAEYILPLSQSGIEGEGLSLQLMDVRKVAKDLGAFTDSYPGTPVTAGGSKWIWLLPLSLLVAGFLFLKKKYFTI